MADLPSIKSNDDYAKLPVGSDYLDPSGKQRQKPFRVTDEGAYKDVPEGKHYLDPQGQLRLKPSYEGLDEQAQSHFNMAANEKEQRNVLAHFYGEQNLSPPGEELYVKRPGGKRLKPDTGGILPRAGAFVQSESAPALFAGIGATVGGRLGAGLGFAGGLPAGGVGAIPGAVVGGGLGSAAGAYLGSMAGQGYNDILLALSGEYERTPLEELTKLGEAGTEGVEGLMGGAILGKVVSSAGNAIKRGAADPLKSYLRWMGDIGKDPEAEKTARELSEKGVSVPVSQYAPSLFIPKMIQSWAKQLTGYDPVLDAKPQFKIGSYGKAPRKSGEDYYNEQAADALKALGVKVDTPVTKATSSVSSEDAGKAAIKKVRLDQAKSDAHLEMKHKEALRHLRKDSISDADRVKSVSELQSSVEDNLKVAQRTVDVGWEDINKTKDELKESLKLFTQPKRKNVGVGSNVKSEPLSKGEGINVPSMKNPGDLSRLVSEKVEWLKKAVKKRAGVIYRAADDAAGGLNPNVKPILTTVSDFLKAIPPEFRGRYPEEVKLLEKMTDPDRKDGGVTFGELRRVRAFLAQGINYNDLTSDVRSGVKKKLVSEITHVLRDGESVPELKPAVDLLNKADRFYEKNIGIFKENDLQKLIDLQEGGVPPDAQKIARTLLENQGGWTERMSKFRRMLGPQIWNQVKAADMENILSASRGLYPGTIDTKKFASEVLDRFRNGSLENGYGKEIADKLLAQARRLPFVGGNQDFHLLPGDTVVEAMRRVEEGRAQIRKIVEKDPVGLLTSETARMEREFADLEKSILNKRNARPMSFLAHPSTLAQAAADKILRSPDLIKAAAARFSPVSKEFTLLRQVAAQRILQKNLAGTLGLEEDFKDLTKDVQKLLFPNGLDAVVIKLAKDMKFLFPHGAGEEIGTSLSGVALGLHPKGAFEKVIHKKLPGPEILYRTTLFPILTTVSDFVSSPELVRYLTSRARPLTEAEVKELSDRAMKSSTIGGILGASVGSASAASKTSKSSTGKPEQVQGWKELYKQKYGKSPD